MSIYSLNTAKKNTILVTIFLMITGAVFVETVFAAAVENVRGVALYREAPSAYELAKAMFPPKTRNMTVKPVNVTKPAAVAFIINFQYDSTNVLSDSRPYLDALGTMLNFKQLKGKSIKIEGHADAKGDSNYNLILSESRAKAIKKYLTSVHRIDPARLITVGYGEAKLLLPTDPLAAENRRAEFSPWNEGTLKN